MSPLAAFERLTPQWTEVEIQVTWTLRGREWWWRERETPEIRKASSRSYEQKSLGRRMHVQPGFFGAFYLWTFSVKPWSFVCSPVLQPLPPVLLSASQPAGYLQTASSDSFWEDFREVADSRRHLLGIGRREEGKPIFLATALLPGHAFGKWQSHGWAPTAPVRGDAPVGVQRDWVLQCQKGLGSQLPEAMAGEGTCASTAAQPPGLGVAVLSFHIFIPRVVQHPEVDHSSESLQLATSGELHLSFLKENCSFWLFFLLPF